MANAAVAAWTACIKQLQQAANAAAAGVTEAAARKTTVNLGEYIDKLKQQPTLPHAAWKRLVHNEQVTGKLAALCTQALQQPASGHVISLACYALNAWLDKSLVAMAASPASHAAAAVGQQLQQSRLLQHLGAGMDAAAARLTAAVAAHAAASAGTSSSSSAGRTVAAAARQQLSIFELFVQTVQEEFCCEYLLETLELGSRVLSATRQFSNGAALPAAPAAMRLIFTGLEAHSKLQEQEQEQPPLQVVSNLFSKHWRLALRLALADASGSAGAPQSPPDTDELSPDLVRFLAIMLVATVLGLDTSKASCGRATSAGGGSSSGSGAGSSRGSQLQSSQGKHQQPGSGSVLSNGVRLESLSALSCSLFELLGVSKETVLQAARLAKSAGLATMAVFEGLVSTYCHVSKYQADQAKGVFSTQMLLQLETELLLSLAVLQLTASIPDNYPGAQQARDFACQLSSCPALHSLWSVPGLHKLPRPAAYTGPQLALQLLPSPLGPSQQPAAALPQQQQMSQQQKEKKPPVPPQRQEHQQQQPTQWCVLAPTAPLLSELLPLLTHHCLTRLQQQQEQQSQQPASSPNGESPIALTPAVEPCLKGLSTLLLCSVVPAPDITPAAAATAPRAATATAGQYNNQVTYSCVLHAQTALMASACDIIRTFEAALRLAAAGFYAEATARTAAGEAEHAITSSGAAGVRAAKLWSMFDTVLVQLCHHRVTGDYPHTPAPLVLLALAAGPQVQRQFHSLLASMVKFSQCSKGTLGMRCCAAAGVAASALLFGAYRQQQQPLEAAARCQTPGAADCNSGHAAVMHELPFAVILGHCCMQWGQQLQVHPMMGEQQQGSCSSQQQQEQGHSWGFWALSVLQHWLAASTRDQLSAAGYAPLPVLQQLEQSVVLCTGSPCDAETLLVAAQQFQSSGLAVCSFAVPSVCNNPSCTSMSGLSELATMSGRSCMCGGCRVAHYCGRACQRAAWKQHKPVCKALKAVAAGDGACAGIVTAAGSSIQLLNG